MIMNAKYVFEARLEDKLLVIKWDSENGIYHARYGSAKSRFQKFTEIWETFSKGVKRALRKTWRESGSRTQMELLRISLLQTPEYHEIEIQTKKFPCGISTKGTITGFPRSKMS
jgi:hypothetical protein